MRAIYDGLRDDRQIFMRLIYPKSKKDNLTDRETALLRFAWIEKWGSCPFTTVIVCY